jgi:hypothetical protein
MLLCQGEELVAIFNGVKDEAPNPFYDPLLFAIEECHKKEG